MKKYHFYLTTDERRIILHSLIDMMDLQYKCNSRK